MSLIPYQSLEGREIVLRHRNAIVVRDPDSQRLEIRGYAECPTCHQPLRPSSSERPFDRSYETSPESYVNPSYFRMLHVRNGALASNGPPSSPGRRFKPALPNNGSSSEGHLQAAEGRDGAFASGSTHESPHADSSRIKREAFTPNYFKTFFVEERVLGRGGKGIVLLVRHEIDGCHLGHFACKRVPIGDDHAWLEKVLIEVELLANLSHPNLVSYRHVWLEDTQLTMFGPHVPCAFILQQYCNSGDLHQYVVGSAPREATKEELKERMRRRSRGKLEESNAVSGDKPRLSFEEIYSLFKDITSGVAYLHSANYIHRDLKPSNCLLHSEGGKYRCLISDFGEVQPEYIIRKSTGSTGTISYCAPEVLRIDSEGNYANFTTKSDVFSLGMILYFMCFGRLPYRSANTLQEELEDIDELRAEITDWKGFQDEKRERPDLPAKLYMLLKKLLALDPAQRPSATEVLSAMKSETNVDSISRDRNYDST
ncbi:putative serine/threonine-protein kinase iksA [Escovopsis weberi]|uniref:non-specific serine/threonine protein kinase n=1 Tax=Escovopsis weberi TaxID=150374 RepID=A0A0M8N152_ESCWE|nr:putative serine/threonine-protein kinase iksA [Escovopsis weberi]